MRLQPLSFHIAAGLALPLLAASPAQAPHYTAMDAVRAEWMRTPPAFSAEQLAKLPAADRARLELSLRRIGRPGAPELLPVELAHPTQGIWDQKAEEARTPQARFTALFFLNRFKDKNALKALNGLKPEDAKTWPRHLHLEAQIASARINGGEVSVELQAFLDAMQKAGKVDPVRAQAAQLRLVMAGKEKELLPAIQPTSGALLSILDAWNRSPWDRRVTRLEELFEGCEPEFDLSFLGLHTLGEFSEGSYQRLFEGIPETAPEAHSAGLREFYQVVIQSAANHCSETPTQTHSLERL
ncbi:MAG TPA: hypothetical protein VJ483_08565, partial [Holophagaceae bacterium]|nr:hypothetical protein [Holophagaceae bacterium]